jgi:sec-independent protein translocase protein TatA
MFGLGPMELVIIFLVILLVFGAKRIPEIAQGMGKGISEFKKAAREVTNEIDSVKTTANYTAPPVQPQLTQPQPVHQQPAQPQVVRNDLREEKKIENSPSSQG